MYVYVLFSACGDVWRIHILAHAPDDLFTRLAKDAVQHPQHLPHILQLISRLARPTMPSRASRTEFIASPAIAALAFPTPDLFSFMDMLVPIAYETCEWCVVLIVMAVPLTCTVPPAFEVLSGSDYAMNRTNMLLPRPHCMRCVGAAPVAVCMSVDPPRHMDCSPA
jgi:hypothetical protein